MKINWNTLKHRRNIRYKNWEVDPYRQPVRNVEQLLTLADFMEAHGEEWDQTTWWSWLGDLEKDRPNYCQAHRCLAGNTNHINRLPLIDYLEPDLGVKMKINGKVRRVEHALAAQIILGLTPAEARFLFEGGWRPANNVSESLRLLAEGRAVNDPEVTQVKTHRREFENVFRGDNRLSEILAGW